MTRVQANTRDWMTKSDDMQRQIHLTDSLKGKNIEELTDEDLSKIITPQHKESVRNLRELLGDI